mmetsp:Transcript_7623/g.47046  ORF Transcript_7623/g.47046 Transcript_7623/m.47046 type:complete len:129 (+) Transcript_7623:429-815(+)
MAERDRQAPKRNRTHSKRFFGEKPARRCRVGQPGVRSHEVELTMEATIPTMKYGKRHGERVQLQREGCGNQAADPYLLRSNVNVLLLSNSESRQTPTRASALSKKVSFNEMTMLWKGMSAPSHVRPRM